jgi:hypothetical protein
VRKQARERKIEREKERKRENEKERKNKINRDKICSICTTKYAKH